MFGLPEREFFKLWNKVEWKECACGWGAAVANICITYPINKIIFRQVILLIYIKLRAH